MTNEEKRVIRDAFKSLERTLLRAERHLQQSIAKIDVAERERTVELRDELKKANRRLTAIEKAVTETNNHAKFTSGSIERLTRALVKAKVIEQDAATGSDTGYSEVLGTPRRPRRR